MSSHYIRKIEALEESLREKNELNEVLKRELGIVRREKSRLYKTCMENTQKFSEIVAIINTGGT